MPSTTVRVAPYRTFNPATGELVRSWEALENERAEALLARAHEAHLRRRQVPVEERVRLFRKVADLITEHAEELGRQTTLEMGKPLSQAIPEAHGAAEMFTYYAEHGPELLADEVVPVPGISHAVVRREPVGVVLGIEPWNAPLYQAMRATAPNLMLGNTVIVKPAAICAGSTLLFDQIFTEAGFPEGTFQTGLLSRDQVSSFIADDRVRGVTLTGSDQAGAIVGEQASRHIKPVVLELGGSDAFVVLDSADVAKAAETAATCRLIIGGQACALPKRVIVTEKVADEFIAKFLPLFTDQRIGDPFDAATTLGPMSSESAADLLQEQYQDAVDKGATVLAAGGKLEGPGAYFQPAVLTDLTPDMRLYYEEAFGPLGLVFRVPNADAAIELGNDTKYGLGGSVFAEDIDEAKRVASCLDTGAVGINQFLPARVELPFGGTKFSGVGRELGRTGMDQFANIKSYVLP